MKKIILLLSIITLTNCSQVDENKIKDDTKNNIDNFLQTSNNINNNTEHLEYSNEDIKGKSTIQDNIDLEYKKENILNKEVDNNLIKLETNNSKIEDIKYNDGVKQDIEEEIINTDNKNIIIDISEIENINLDETDINIDIDINEIEQEDTLLEETTYEDIEELLDLLIENN